MFARTLVGAGFPAEELPSRPSDVVRVQKAASLPPKAHNSNRGGLASLLGTEEGRNSFRITLQKELSEENLDFWVHSRNCTFSVLYILGTVHSGYCTLSVLCHLGTVHDMLYYT